MKSKLPFTVLELFVVIFLILTLAMFILPGGYVVREKAEKTKVLSAAKSIGLIMIAYAEDDIKNFKMPYPLPIDKEKVWGNSRNCWSTSVVELLFKQKYMKKGDEAQLLSAGNKGKTKSMHLNDSTANENLFWSENTALDFQVFCDKDLTSNVSGKMVLVATYDNENIEDCQFEGSGWVIFYADKTTEFVKRAKTKEFNSTNTSVNKIEGSITGKDIILRKNIPESEGGPGTFGNMLGGGSTELMGKKDTDAVYKALVR